MAGSRRPPAASLLIDSPRKTCFNFRHGISVPPFHEIASSFPSAGPGLFLLGRSRPACRRSSAGAAAAASRLFDGKSLAGWEGDPKIWRVEDGLITGGSLTETVKRNEFLATTKEYGNFIVRFKIKLTGSEGFINSGFQIRSQRVPGDSEMAGYQCDFGDPSWWGCIYDESRRNKLMAQSDMKTLEPVLKRERLERLRDPRRRTAHHHLDQWRDGRGLHGSRIRPSSRPAAWASRSTAAARRWSQVKDLTIEELPATPQRQGAREPEKSASESPLPPDGGSRPPFSLAPGLEMELVVEEDLEKGYGKFVAVQFDQHGRLWTMTALEYPVDANENPAAAEALYASKAQDKILVYDSRRPRHRWPRPAYARSRTVFADGLAIPLGILPLQRRLLRPARSRHRASPRHRRRRQGRQTRGRPDRLRRAGFPPLSAPVHPRAGRLDLDGAGRLQLRQGPVGPDGKVTEFDQTRMAKFRPDGSRLRRSPATARATSGDSCSNGEGEAFIQEANDFGYPVMPFHEYANYPGCSNAQWKSYAPGISRHAPISAWAAPA